MIPPTIPMSMMNAASRSTGQIDQGMTITGPALEPSTITVSARVDVNFVSKDGEPVDEDHFE